LQDEDNEVSFIVQEVFGLQLGVTGGEDGDGSTTDKKIVENDDAQLYAWEQEAKRILESKILALNEDNKDEPKMKIGAIIIDPTIPYAIGQILIQLFNNWNTRNMQLADYSNSIEVRYI